MPSGPTAQQVQEAQRRAEADKAKALSQKDSGGASYSLPDKFAPRQYDCAKLNQQRAEAFGRRNGALHTSRDSGANMSGSVDAAHSEIMRIERHMLQGGCKPT